jgi:acyl-CoA thioester hydrolase
MLTHETTVRVRYAETDQMGYVYYGNYATWFEVARVELIRSMGFTYKGMEEQGVLLPVLDLEVKYIRPAYYDDLLTIRTTVPEMPLARIKFLYEVYNEAGTLLTKAATTLVFIDKERNKPCPMPEAMQVAFKPYFL